VQPVPQLRAVSAERHGPALIFADVTEEGHAGPDAAVVRRDVHEHALVRIEFSQHHLDFLVPDGTGFQYCLAGGLIGDSYPWKVPGYAVVGAVDVDAELIGGVQSRNIAAKMADVRAGVAVEIKCNEEEALLRFRFQEKLFLPLDPDHSVGVAEFIGPDEQFEPLLGGFRVDRIGSGSADCALWDKRF